MRSSPITPGLFFKIVLLIKFLAYRSGQPAGEKKNVVVMTCDISVDYFALKHRLKEVLRQDCVSLFLL